MKSLYTYKKIVLTLLLCWALPHTCSDSSWHDWINKNTTIATVIFLGLTTFGYSTYLHYANLKEFHQACMQDDIKKAYSLIQQGVAINALDQDGWTPLQMACLNNNVKLAHMLIHHGAQVNKKDTYNWSSLEIACLNTNSALVQLLLNNDADVTIKNYTDDGTSLHTACIYNTLTIATYLIEHGAHINTTNRHAITPLYYACSKGHITLVQLLVHHGAIIDQSPTVNYPPAITAYLKSICDTEKQFNPTETPATPEILQRLIACNKHPEYIVQHFAKQPQTIQKKLIKHALIHNRAMVMTLCSNEKYHTFITLSMFRDNTYLQKRYKTIPHKLSMHWYTKTALPLTTTTVIFN